MSIAEIFGWFGSVAYAICALPQAILCIKNKSAKGFSKAYAVLAFSGSVLSTIYALPNFDYILFLNFGCNIVFWLIILYYCFKSKSTNA